MIWIVLKFSFVDVPRSFWRSFIIWRCFKKNYRQAMGEVMPKGVKMKIPPQITINDPSVLSAEKIVDAHLRNLKKGG